MAIPPSATSAIVVIFALTYLGIALGRVPGLKLNRTGIVLLGAIAVAVLSRFPTSTIVNFINWPTILLLFGFFVISAQLHLAGFFDRVAAAISSRLGQPQKDCRYYDGGVASLFDPALSYRGLFRIGLEKSHLRRLAQ